MNATRAFAFAIVLLVAVPSASSELLFGPASPLPEPVNDENGNISPAISRDELRLYFASNRPGSEAVDIYVTKRNSEFDPWTEPENLGSPINTSAWESAPNISDDGKELYFTRDSEATATDIWVSKRVSTDDDAPWGEPENLGTAINSNASDDDPCISTNRLELYFDSNRRGEFEIYVSEREDVTESFGAPEVVPGTAGFGFANISFDGLSLFLSNNQDIYVTTRESLNDGFTGRGTKLNAPVNSEFHEGDGVLSADGSTFYFTSRRPGVPTGGEFGDRGIWQAPVIPEPTSLVCVALGFVGLLAVRQRQRELSGF